MSWPISHVVSRIVVAIPVRDEAERIGTCLDALNTQHRRPDLVVLLLNNCRDATAAVVQAKVPYLNFQVEAVSRCLPPHQATAGHARHLAMAFAARKTDPAGVLMTTDADAIAPPEWIERNLIALQHGADVVCGRALIDQLEATSIPRALHEDDVREQQLIALLDSLAWALDPELHDPPLRHTEASGASLAVRSEAFRRVGGMPDVASSEDRAFVRALWMMDARVRHDPTVWTTVSGRLIGRAKGGMAETLRRRIKQQDEFTDAQVEPARMALQRYKLRRRLRHVRSGVPDATLAQDLGLSPAQVDDALMSQFFGEAWAELEAASSVLRRRRVRFTELPKQIATAERLLRRWVVGIDSVSSPRCAHPQLHAPGPVL